MRSDSSRLVACVATPVNLAWLTVVDSVMPLNIVANPVIATSGLNSSGDTMAVIWSLTMNFNMLLNTPALLSTVSGITEVCPDPATVVGPISVQAVPL